MSSYSTRRRLTADDYRSTKRTMIIGKLNNPMIIGKLNNPMIDRQTHNSTFRIAISSRLTPHASRLTPYFPVPFIGSLL